VALQPVLVVSKRWFVTADDRLIGGATTERDALQAHQEQLPAPTGNYLFN